MKQPPLELAERLTLEHDWIFHIHADAKHARIAKFEA